MSSSMFFAGWTGLIRVVVVGTVAYAALVVLLRLGGKRTLSTMNAFDFVVTVSLGSTLATMLLSKDVPLAEGVLALALLVALQYAVAWTEVRFARVRGLVRNEPTLLAWRGKLVWGVMRRERLAEADVLAAARKKGVVSLRDLNAAILETDGSISIIERSRGRTRSRLTPLGRLRLGAGQGEA